MRSINIKSSNITFAALALLLGATTVLTPVMSQKASALSGSEFKAGRIMDDAVFFNGNSMSTAQIQEFMNAKRPDCDTNGQKTIYDPVHGDTVTRKVYSERRGVSTPFICLKSYKQDTTNKSPEGGLCNGHTAGNKSSAQIIYEVAQSCGVSPKVLLVLLQKEQSLVTDDWPWPIQYRSATGYGCPDTAPCDEQYYGFFNQVYMAARVYKYYAKYPTSFNHIAGRKNYVLYNPNTNCGGSEVYIENQATAGLYNYTPYQPNAAALNNLYGTGDSCSAYGNRNFWRMYRDWFGSTTGSCSTTVGYQYSTAGGWILPPSELFAGDRINVRVKVRNTGSETWSKTGSSPVRLGLVNDKPSIMYTPGEGWISNTRVAMKEATVSPCETATFDFTYTSPQSGGFSLDYINLVAENKTWLPDRGWFIGLNNLVFRATKTSESPIDSTPAPGLDQTMTMSLRNDGNFTWNKAGSNPLRLGKIRDVPSPFATKDGWLSPIRVAMQEATVAPGETATFKFRMRTPYRKGVYYEAFAPLLENKRWGGPVSMHKLESPSPTYGYEVTGIVTTQVPLVLAPNAEGSFTVKLKNTGNSVWHNSNTGSPLRLGTENSRDHASVMYHSSWVSNHRIDCSAENVQQHQTTLCSFKVKAPSKPGTYVETLRPLIEMMQWLPGNPFRIGFEVKNQ
jgi:hypothetical protein